MDGQLSFDGLLRNVPGCSSCWTVQDSPVRWVHRGCPCSALAYKSQAFRSALSLPQSISASVSFSYYSRVSSALPQDTFSRYHRLKKSHLKPVLLKQKSKIKEKDSHMHTAYPTPTPQQRLDLERVSFQRTAPRSVTQTSATCLSS